MSNLFAQFRKLLPQTPRQVGSVIATDGGVCTVELPGGAQAVALGGGQAIGDRVFFRDGVIEGPAPNLPLVSIEV